MRKKIKKNLKMIDMTDRLNIEILHATVEEEDIWEAELKEIEKLVEKRMKKYDENLKKMITSALKESSSKKIEQDSLYFIEKYKGFIEKRDIKGMENRLKNYYKFLDE